APLSPSEFLMNGATMWSADEQPHPAPSRAHRMPVLTPRVLLAALALVPLTLALDAAPLHGQAPDWSAEQARYHDHARLSSELENLRRAHPLLIEIEEIAQSPGGRAVHAVRIGSGDDVDERPALLILANAYGPHLVGSEIALAAIQDLAGSFGSDDSVSALLRRTTIYVLPRLNPDAAEAFFSRPLTERIRNAEAFDEDRDGRVDEDGAVDLNGDGLVSAMRVQDPTGAWMPDA